MAKSTVATNGTSKVRFIMLEADGDIREITQAITQALRPVQPLARPHAAIAARVSPQGSEPQETEPEPDDPSADLVAEEANGLAKPRTRRISSPKVLDVDLNSGEMPFEKFAKERNPEEALKRYLLVAYWCKKFREGDTITAAHVYTCYKKMGWGTDIKDFAQPLRDLARSGRGTMKSGAFVINHIGEDFAEKMTTE